MYTALHTIISGRVHIHITISTVTTAVLSNQKSNQIKNTSVQCRMSYANRNQYCHQSVAFTQTLAYTILITREGRLGRPRPVYHGQSLRTKMRTTRIDLITDCDQSIIINHTFLLQHTHSKMKYFTLMKCN